MHLLALCVLTRTILRAEDDDDDGEGGNEGGQGAGADVEMADLDAPPSIERELGAYPSAPGRRVASRFGDDDQVRAALRCTPLLCSGPALLCSAPRCDSFFSLSVSVLCRQMFS